MKKYIITLLVFISIIVLIAVVDLPGRISVMINGIECYYNNDLYKAEDEKVSDISQFIDMNIYTGQCISLHKDEKKEIYISNIEYCGNGYRIYVTTLTEDIKYEGGSQYFMNDLEDLSVTINSDKTYFATNVGLDYYNNSYRYIYLLEIEDMSMEDVSKCSMEIEFSNIYVRTYSR